MGKVTIEEIMENINFHRTRGDLKEIKRWEKIAKHQGYDLTNNGE